jgi:hypothetical protein
MPRYQEHWIDAPAMGLNISLPANVIDSRQGTEVENIHFKGGVMRPRRGNAPFEGGFLDGSVTGFHVFRDAAGTKTPVIGTERDLLKWDGSTALTGTCTVAANGRDVSAISVDILPSALPSIASDVMPEDLIRFEATVSGVVVLSDWFPILWITKRGAGTGELKVRGVIPSTFHGSSKTFYIKKTFRFLTPRTGTGTAHIANGSSTLTGVGTTWNTGGANQLKVGDRIMITGDDTALNYHRRWYSVRTVVSDTQITLNEKYEGGTINAVDATTYTARKCFTGGREKRWVMTTYIKTVPKGAFLFAVNGTNLAQKWDGLTETTADATTNGAGGGNISAKYVITFGSYLIYGNISNAVQSWRCSDFDKPEDLDGGVASEIVFSEGGDEITGIKRTSNFLEVHKRSGMSIYAEVGGDPPFDRVRYVSDVGNILPYGLGGTTDLSFFMGRDNFYIFDSGGVRELDPQNNSIWRRFTEILGNGSLSLAHTFYSEKDGIYYLFFPEGSAAKISNRAVVVSDRNAVSFYSLLCSAAGTFPAEDVVRWLDIPVGVKWDDLSGTWDGFGNTLALPTELTGDGDGLPYTRGGNATFTNGSAVVSVADPATALWLSILKAGDYIRTANGTFYTISSVDGNGQATLTRNFAETTVTAAYEARPSRDGAAYFQRGFEDRGLPYTTRFRSKVFLFPDKTILRGVAFQSTNVSSIAQLYCRVYRRYDESDNFDLAAEGFVPLTGANTYKFDFRVSGRQFYFEFGSSDVNQNWVVRRWGFMFTPMSVRRGKIDPTLGGSVVSGSTAPFGGGGVGGGIGGGVGGVLNP